VSAWRARARTACCSRPLTVNFMPARLTPACTPPHRGGAWSVCWSASNEHQLYAGDGTGAVRLWDIRRSGSRALLDMNATPQTAWAAGRAARCGRGRRQRSCSRTSDGGEQGSGSRRGRAKRRQERQVSPQPRRRQRRQQHSEGEEDRPRAGSRVVPLAHEGAVVGVHATADDRSILTAGADHRVRLWDVGECPERASAWTGGVGGWGGHVAVAAARAVHSGWPRVHRAVLAPCCRQPATPACALCRHLQQGAVPQAHEQHARRARRVCAARQRRAGEWRAGFFGGGSLVGCHPHQWVWRRQHVPRQAA
jgi:hypothetical protein